MAGTFVRNCPHCLAENCAMTFEGEYVNMQPGMALEVFTTFRCNACGRPSITFHKTHTQAPVLVSALSHNILRGNRLAIERVWPEHKTPELPEHCPEAVGRVYLQALDNFKRSNLDSAVMSFRKCLEVALKTFDSSVGDVQLAKRIQLLAGKGSLAPQLSDWALEVKSLGNSGTHEVEEPSAEDAEQIALFTRQLLIHLFTMPQEVELARAKRNGTH